MHMAMNAWRCVVWHCFCTVILRRLVGQAPHVRASTSFAMPISAYPNVWRRWPSTALMLDTAPTQYTAARFGMITRGKCRRKRVLLVEERRVRSMLHGMPACPLDSSCKACWLLPAVCAEFCAVRQSDLSILSRSRCAATR